VGYDPPLTADAVISELPTPIEPITPVPPENVGTSVTDELYGGVAELGTRLLACGTCTVSVAPKLVTVPIAFETVTVKTEPLSPNTAGGVV
jgi:hypothetical protein